MSKEKDYRDLTDSELENEFYRGDYGKAVNELEARGTIDRDDDGNWEFESNYDPNNNDEGGIGLNLFNIGGGGLYGLAFLLTAVIAIMVLVFFSPVWTLPMLYYSWKYRYIVYLVCIVALGIVYVTKGRRLLANFIFYIAMIALTTRMYIGYMHVIGVADISSILSYINDYIDYYHELPPLSELRGFQYYYIYIPVAIFLPVMFSKFITAVVRLLTKDSEAKKISMGTTDEDQDSQPNNGIFRIVSKGLDAISGFFSYGILFILGILSIVLFLLKKFAYFYFVDYVEKGQMFIFLYVAFSLLYAFVEAGNGKKRETSLLLSMVPMFAVLSKYTIFLSDAVNRPYYTTAIGWFAWYFVYMMVLPYVMTKIIIALSFSFFKKKEKTQLNNQHSNS